MSPTEAELRAFLHEGEGERPDATSAISRALRVRYERRRRITTVVSSAAVVAVVATGLTFLFTRQDDESAGSAADRGTAATAPLAHANAPTKAAPPSASRHSLAGGSAGGGTAGREFHSAKRSPQAAVLSASCPASPTSYALPGGGGLSTYGADEPMFARRPVGMKVCGYSLDSQSAPKADVLSASATRTLTRLIEKSSAVPGPSRMCPSRADDNSGRRVEIISADAGGRRLRTVTITFRACGPAQVTNGTSVRYLDRIPASLRKVAGTGLPAR